MKVRCRIQKVQSVPGLLSGIVSETTMNYILQRRRSAGEKDTNTKKQIETKEIINPN